jgi:hypothetical protein
MPDDPHRAHADEACNRREWSTPRLKRLAGQETIASGGAAVSDTVGRSSGVS